MPTINVLLNDLEYLIGQKLPSEIDQLNDLLSFSKGEVESLENGNLSIEIKDGNRPDLWNVEGISRQLRGALEIEDGLKDYLIKGFSGIEINVDKHLKDIRPYIACSVVNNVNLNDEIIRALMHLQDKLDQTYGRLRQRASIGLYNLRLLTPPIYYDVVKPLEARFIPLGFDQEMNLKEIIDIHPKGLEYGHILKNHKYWPILRDAKKNILSFPPIILH